MVDYDEDYNYDDDNDDYDYEEMLARQQSREAALEQDNTKAPDSESLQSKI